MNWKKDQWNGYKIRRACVSKLLTGQYLKNQLILQAKTALFLLGFVFRHFLLMKRCLNGEKK